MNERGAIEVGYGPAVVRHGSLRLSKTVGSSSCIRGRGSMAAYRLLSLFALLIPPASAVSVNITVDDTFGNSDRTVIPTYLPANSTWHIGSPTEQCDVCAIKPSEFDASQIVDQSWHHGTYYLGIPIFVQVTFPGTAVYVYNVIPNFLKGANTFVNVSFAIDGETVGQFSHIPDSTSEILYSHLVYANTSLSDSLHTLVMSASGRNESLVFFDYLLYTTEIESTPSVAASAISGTASPSSTASTASSSSHRQTGAIAGGVIGGVALLLAIAAILFCLLRRHRRQRSLERRSHPFNDSEPSDIVSTDRKTATMASSPFVRPLSAGGFSNAATLAGEKSVALLTHPLTSLTGVYWTRAAGPSLTCATFMSPSSLSSPRKTFESKREAELERRTEKLLREMRSAAPVPSHPGDQDSTAGSEVLRTSGAGALQGLHEEIAALRGLLSTMAVREQGRSAIGEEVLPRYEPEARPSRGTPGNT
ncbi:hypothetical protein LXA43DRAFT_1051742 [Ganoderma leucocontextum]|nr:hypothetical protein LXA43DRAFT_1051742 [Ganoderma leucocontextum]